MSNSPVHQTPPFVPAAQRRRVLHLSTPIEGWAERRQAPGCSGTRLACNNAAGRAPCGVPCVPPELGFTRVRHSMSGRSRIYPTSAGGTRASRRSTVAILGRGPRFLLRHFLRIRAASSSQPGRSAWRAGPRASRACSCEPQPRDATSRSTFRIASRRRPSRARLMRPIHQSRTVVKSFLTNRSRKFSAPARPRWRPTPRSGRTGWRAPQGCGCRPGWD